MKQDKARTARNRSVKNVLRDLVKKAKTSGIKSNLSSAFQSIDKAAKQNIIHKNKAARMKSALSKSETKKDKKPVAVKKVVKKAVLKKKKVTAKKK